MHAVMPYLIRQATFPLQLAAFAAQTQKNLSKGIAEKGEFPQKKRGCLKRQPPLTKR